MRFTLYSVALLSAAAMAVDLPTETKTIDHVLAQTETDSGSLVDALSKVISSLNNGNQAAIGEKKDDSKPATSSNVGCGVGTNIAITTATNQHINIFVPQDPKCDVAVKKTEGVKIVESDSDCGGANEAVRKALQAKVKSSLTKAVINDAADDGAEAEADDKEVKKIEKEIKAAKTKSAELSQQLKKAGGAGAKKLAQTSAVPMTEEEILALAQLGYGEEDFADEIYDQFA